MLIAPKISVVLCTCNGERWIRHQLQSIMEQTSPVHEIIIHDDLSDDGTWSILEQFAHEHPRIIKVLRNSQRLGAVENFRQAILETTGDYIFLSDQDDQWMPDKVETLLHLFAQNRWAEAIATDAWLMDEQGRRLPGSFWNAMDFDPASVPGGKFGLASFLLCRGNTCCGATMAFRKAAVERLLMQPIPAEVFHDYWIAIYLAMQNSMMLHSTSTIVYRLHASQAIGVPQLFHPPVYSLHPSRQDLLNDCIAIAFGISRLQRIQEALADSTDMQYQLKKTNAHLHAMLTAAKTMYFRTYGWPARKWRLLKHRLKGGEYLRVSIRDLVRI